MNREMIFKSGGDKKTPGTFFQPWDFFFGFLNFGIFFVLLDCCVVYPLGYPRRVSDLPDLY